MHTTSSLAVYEAGKHVHHETVWARFAENVKSFDSGRTKIFDRTQKTLILNRPMSCLAKRKNMNSQPVKIVCLVFIGALSH